MQYNIPPSLIIATNKFHFLIHLFSNLKNTFIISSIRRYLNNNRYNIITTKTRSLLQKVYQWLQNNEKPLQIDPAIASNSFLSVYYKLFQQLYINRETKSFIYILLTYMIQTQTKTTKYVYHLNFSMKFLINSMHGHSGIKVSIKAFNQFFFKTF